MIDNTCYLPSSDSGPWCGTVVIVYVRTIHWTMAKCNDPWHFLPLDRVSSACQISINEVKLCLDQVLTGKVNLCVIAKSGNGMCKRRTTIRATCPTHICYTHFVSEWCCCQHWTLRQWLVLILDHYSTGN